jgi:hypothetical protein
VPASLVAACAFPVEASMVVPVSGADSRSVSDRFPGATPGAPPARSPCARSRPFALS